MRSVEARIQKLEKELLEASIPWVAVVINDEPAPLARVVIRIIETERAAG